MFLFLEEGQAEGNVKSLSQHARLIDTAKDLPFLEHYKSLPESYPAIVRELDSKVQTWLYQSVTKTFE